MTLNDNSVITNNIKKSIELLNIHYFFVFNKAGICLYSRNFTGMYRMNDNLLSAFCSALISFSLEMVGKKLKTINMNNVKIVIIQRDFFFYGFLCHSKQNLILLNEYINKIDERLRDYVVENKININVECINDDNINKFIDDLIGEKFDSYDKTKEKEIIKFLKNFHLENEIEGMVLLNNKDKIVFSSLNQIKLKRLLCQLDFRIKIYNNSILRLFFTSNKELVYTEYINKTHFLILIFDIKTNFGIAEHLSRKIIKSLKSIYEK